MANDQDEKICKDYEQQIYLWSEILLHDKVHEAKPRLLTTRYGCTEPKNTGQDRMGCYAPLWDLGPGKPETKA